MSRRLTIENILNETSTLALARQLSSDDHSVFLDECRGNGVWQSELEEHQLENVYAYYNLLSTYSTAGLVYKLFILISRNQTNQLAFHPFCGVSAKLVEDVILQAKLIHGEDWRDLSAPWLPDTSS